MPRAKKQEVGTVAVPAKDTTPEKEPTPGTCEGLAKTVAEAILSGTAGYNGCSFDGKPKDKMVVVLRNLCFRALANGTLMVMPSEENSAPKMHCGGCGFNLGITMAEMMKRGKVLCPNCKGENKYTPKN